MDNNPEQEYNHDLEQEHEQNLDQFTSNFEDAVLILKPTLRNVQSIFITSLITTFDSTSLSDTALLISKPNCNVTHVYCKD
ncbi:hypothetical protein RCL1_002733 [Eukaryota sp. TZLM3-RCL]